MFQFPVRIEIMADFGLQMSYRFCSTTLGFPKCLLATMQYTYASATVLMSKW